jgi:DNA-binding winged helix-turn-helix (wHTH) protein
MRNEVGPALLRFAQFTLDRATGELYRDGTRVRPQEQPSQVLAALLDRPGEIVTRDDLRERLWKSDTFVDFEHSLNTAVKKLRQALDDSAQAPTFIETLPRRGYRFIAQVEPLTSSPVWAPAAPADDSVPPIPPTDTRRVNKPAVWAAAFGMLVLVAGLAWRVQSRPDRSEARGPAARTTTQLAVMPFRVLADSRQDIAHLGIGLADAITTRLAATRQVGVRPTSAVLP